MSESAHDSANDRIGALRTVVRPRKGPIQELLVRSEDPSALRAAKNVLDLLSSHITRVEGDSLRDLVESIPLERSPEVAEAEFRQAKLNARARQRFLDRYRVLSAEEVHRASARRAKNVHATAHRWRDQGRIFAVTLEGQLYYPAFQFEHGEPKAVFRELIGIGGEHRRGWSMALWLDAPNRWLEGHAPIEFIDTAAERVVDALRQDLTPVG
jgi:hypothetical protein